MEKIKNFWSRNKDGFECIIFIVLCFASIIGVSHCHNSMFKFNYESRWVSLGTINSVRLDDDGQYHFSTDLKAYNDVSNFRVYIKRIDSKTGFLYKQEVREVCTSGNWSDTEWKPSDIIKLELPKDYKIETFAD